jgi:hypothetical protein
MHYVLEVQTLFYRDMLIQIWQVIKTARGAPQGMFFTIGGTTVSWISKLQKVVALSTIEVDYFSATEDSKEMIWLQRFMEELEKKQEDSRLYYDS